MSDPTTKLSERLRELNHAWAEVLEETRHRTLPGEVDTFTDILTECIALAEALETTFEQVRACRNDTFGIKPPEATRSHQIFILSHFLPCYGPPLPTTTS